MIPTCDICGSCFPNVGSLDDHIRKSHNRPDLESAIKKENNGNLPINKVQNRHIPGMQQGFNRSGEIKQANKPSSSIKCDVCDVYFARGQNLKRHREGVVHKTKVLHYQQMGRQEQNLNMENTSVKQEQQVELSESINSN